MSISLRQGSGRQAKQIASSTLWQLASQVTMAALSILTTKFVYLGLSRELVGNYNSAYGYLQLFGILADFGIYAVAVREVARAKDKSETLGALIVLRVITLLTSLGAALLIAWTAPQWRGTPLPLGITIAAMVPFFTLLAGIIRTAFQVTYRMHYVFIAEVLQRIITTALIGFFIVMGIRESENLHVYHVFLWIGGIGAFVLFLLSLVYGNRIFKIKPNVDPELLKRYARLAAPYGIAFLCTAFYRQFDTTLIALLRPDFEIQNAYYGSVVRMMDMGYLIPTFLLNSTLPIVSERESRGEDTRTILGKTLFILLLLGSISFLFATLWSRPLVSLLTTEKYLSTPGIPGSDTALSLLAIPMLLNGLIQYSFYVLLTKHAWRRLVASLGIGVLISLVLNVILIPKVGFVGNAMTSIATHVFLTTILLPQAFRVLPARFSWKQGLQWLLFTILLGVGLGLGRSFLVGNLSTLIGLVAATVWMGIVAYATGIHRALRGAR